MSCTGWKIARKAVQNAKAAPHFDEQARAALPVFANVASSDDDTDGNAHVEHDSPKRRTQSTTHSRASEQVNGTQRAAATVRPRQSDSNLAGTYQCRSQVIPGTYCGLLRAQRHSSTFTSIYGMNG